MSSILLNVSNAVLKKLRNVMGEPTATSLMNEVMQEAGLENLDTPANRLSFAETLMTRGGLNTAIGRSIKIQAMLHGASASG